MTKQTLSRRNFVGGSMLAIGTASLPACGGGAGTDGATAAATADDRLTSQGLSSRVPVVTVATPAASGTSKTGNITTGAVFTSLKVNASQVGSFVYAATVLPLQGQVPAGATLLSPDDTTLRCTVLSRWSDGSAAVVIAAGNVTITTPGETTLQLQAGSASAEVLPVSVNRLSKLLNSVKVELGKLGTIALTDFSSPERIWWANGNTLCARYRVKAPAHDSIEAVIDVHALGGRAFVEVVLENSKMNTASPIKPAAASYAAVVSVNGTSVATVQSNGAPEGEHSAFRAWYASTWIGGDPGLRVVQAVADLQKHPLLFQMDRGGGDTSGYAADTYVPWGTGRHRPIVMGAGGDHASIGPLPQWEASFLQTGSPATARATEASALAVLGYNVNYRDASTGLVPNFADIGARAQASGSVRWPSQTNVTEAMTWETAHSPAVGLMAFIARPSPVYIEIAQKAAVWNGTWSGDSTPNWTSGVFGYWYNLRGRAWGIRSLAHAALLTPDGHAWRDAAVTAMANNVTYMSAWMTNAKATLNCAWDYSPDSLQTHATNSPHFQVAMWQHHYLITEYHKLAQAKFLSGAQQTALVTLADWLALQPVRWVNERSDGGWRYVPYSTAIGPSITAINSPATWDQEMRLFMTDAPAATTGPWMTFYNNVASSYASFQSEGLAGATYVSYMWAALAAAVERGVPGATTAWNTITTKVTNLDGWRAGFINDPRWGASPRTAAIVATSTPPVGAPGSLVGDAWTPERGSDGLVTPASWATVPTNRWVTVTGTRLDALDAQIAAAVPGWRDYGNSNWAGMSDAWSGMAIDTAGSRMWLMGGGHLDSSNNGLYRFDALRMAWSIEEMPSNTNAWSAGYKGGGMGTFTMCGESDAVAQAAITAGTIQAINGPYYDELPWDGKPTARHTYASMVFSPEANELVMVCRRLWRYSLSDKRWVYKRLIRDQGAQWMDGESVIGIYDEAKREVLTSSCGSNALYRSTGYALTTQSWTNWAAPWNRYHGVADTRVGRKVAVVGAPERMVGQYASPGRYWLYDLDTRALETQGEVQFSGGLTRNDFPADDRYYDGYALTYLPSLNRYWLLTMMGDNSMKFIEVDPTTTPWTMRPAPAMAGAVPTPPAFIKRKLVYLPALNAVVLCATATKEMYLYRL